MIKIDRGEPPRDTALDKERDKKLEEIRKLANSGELKSKCIDNLWSDSKAKKFLHQSQNGKCCYCERKRNKKIETDVEHFRPKAGVKEAKKHQGYWWLAYSWENLFIACKTCNQEYKQTRFPLKDEGKRAYKEDCDLGEEKPFLINPLEEDPELFIDYDLEETHLMAKAIGKCERGEKTVDELTGINDREVMEQRAGRLKDYNILVRSLELVRFLENNGTDELRSMADKLRSEADRCLREHISSRSEFSGFARFYFKEKGCL